jgi:hypothetical protein
MILLFFIWALRMININFSVNPCHLWCPIMSWKIPVNFSRIFITLLSRLTLFREFILPKTTFNRTFSIFESYCYSITTVIIWIFLFFVRIILWLELNVWWYRNIRALILFLLYLNRFLLYRFFVCWSFLVIIILGATLSLRFSFFVSFIYSCIFIICCTASFG